MAKFAGEGAKVYYLVLTDGSSGTTDRTITPQALRGLRRQEQRRAGEILGLSNVFFLDYPDGQLQATLEVKKDIVKMVRQLQPDVLVALDPTLVYSAQQGMVNHPDHRAAGQASLDAVYPLARDHMAFPELVSQGYGPHKTPHILLARFGNESTNFGVDITSTLEQKTKALAAHASQFPDMPAVNAKVHTMAAEAGKMYGGAKYAEAFVRIDIN